jgi:histidinol-phosphate aminotransferase
MDPYQPPSSGRQGYLRLDFNENTEGCSPAVIRAIRRAVTPEQIAMYPEYESTRAFIARGFGARADETQITNGTDDAILLLMNVFLEPGQRVIVAEPTFAMYRFYASVIGGAVVDVDRGPDLEFPLTGVRREAAKGARMILIDNPNNPGGTVLAPKDIEGLLRDFPRTMVLVDEAYYDFYGKTVIPWIRRYKNLAVARTFSKAHGLAGLRIGCLFTHRETAAHLRKAYSPYSVNIVAMVAACAALRDDRRVQAHARRVRETREWFQAQLAKHGLDFVPSHANFVLVRFGTRAAQVKNRLRRQGILVRDRSYELPGCLRITIGTRSQMQRLLRELRKVLR